MNGSNKTRKQILICNCGGERIDPSIMSAVKSFLQKSEYDVTCFSDLCGLAADKSQSLNNLVKEDTQYLVLGCFRRTMDIMFSMSGNNVSFTFEHVNLIETSQEMIIERIKGFCSTGSVKGEYRELGDDSGWPSWYPLMDYSRCTACGQCADFCLFGVYEKNDGRITVTNPKGCKNNCPACARICPVSAIIFPKYKHGGAVGGSDLIDEQAEQLRQTADIADFLGSDIYSALEKRKAKRRSIIRDEAMRKAMEERDDALKGEQN